MEKGMKNQIEIYQTAASTEITGKWFEQPTSFVLKQVVGEIEKRGRI